jgi:hypothetical protein
MRDIAKEHKRLIEMKTRNFREGEKEFLSWSEKNLDK